MKAIFRSGKQDAMRGLDKTAAFSNRVGSYKGSEVQGIVIEPEGARSLDLFYYKDDWYIGYVLVDGEREVVKLEAGL